MKNTFIVGAIAASTLAAASAGTGLIQDGGGAASAGYGNEPARPLDIRNDGKPMLSQGTQEFGVAGAVNFDEDVRFNLALSYGYFIKDNWEVGVRLFGQGGESTDDSYGGGFFTEYNFANDSKLVPYIGGSLNWEEFNSDAFDEGSITVGIDLGLKYFLRENLALVFSVGGEYALEDTLQDDFDQEVRIGTRFFF